MSRPRNLLLYDDWADRSVVADFDAFQAANAVIATHDLYMFVYQYVDLSENILRTHLNALPTSFALSRVKTYVFSPVLADHCLFPCFAEGAKHSPAARDKMDEAEDDQKPAELVMSLDECESCPLFPAEQNP